MKFSKEFLLDRLGEKPIDEKIIGQSRWAIQRSEIFEHEGKFYLTVYSVGATEMQDEGPYEYAPEEIECPEMHKVSKTVEVWEPIGA